jgi:hypothetical protein
MKELKDYLLESVRDKGRELETIEQLKQTIAFETSEALFVVVGIVKDSFDEDVIVGKLNHEPIEEDNSNTYVVVRKPNLVFTTDLSSFPYFFTTGSEAARFAARVVTPATKTFVKDKIVCRVALATVVAIPLKTYVVNLEQQLKTHIKTLSSILSSSSF